MNRNQMVDGWHAPSPGPHEDRLRGQFTRFGGLRKRWRGSSPTERDAIQLATGKADERLLTRYYPEQFPRHPDAPPLDERGLPWEDPASVRTREVYELDLKPRAGRPRKAPEPKVITDVELDTTINAILVDRALREGRQEVHLSDGRIVPLTPERTAVAHAVLAAQMEH